MREAGFPEINTFGALMRFAITLEDYCVGLYEKAGEDEAIAELKAKHLKRRERLEEALRLKLNEVTIEPVTTLKREDYLVDVGDTGSMSLEEGKAIFRKVEEASARFYTDSAAYSEPIAREVMRLFERMAKESAKFVKRLD